MNSKKPTLSSNPSYKEDDLFKSNAFLDSYGKVYAQMKKNLEGVLETGNIEYMSDESSDFTCIEDEDLPVFDEEANTFSVFVNPESGFFKLPVDLLHLDTLTNFIDVDTLNKALDADGMKKLRSLLPAQSESEQNESMRRLFSGNSFHFGQNPLNSFLSLAKEGTFTSMRYQERQIENKLALASYLSQIEEGIKIAKSKLTPRYVVHLKNLLGKRRAQKQLEEILRQTSDSEKSDISFADLQAAVDFDQASAGYTTDGSQEEREFYRRRPQFAGNSSNTNNMRRNFQNSTYNNNNNNANSSNNNNSNNNNNNGNPNSNNNNSSNNNNAANANNINNNNDESNNSDGYSGEGQREYRTMNLNDQVVPYHKTKRNKVPVSKEWLDNYREQERQRYENPTKPWVFVCQNNVKTCVAPVCKKLNVSLQSRPRDHAFLKQNRSPYITILSLVRDACSRMVGGKGTRFDICELLKESQYINSDLKYEKVSTIVSGALDRLHYLEDPCIKYDQEKKVWFYLHGDRDEEHPAWKEEVYDNPMNY